MFGVGLRIRDVVLDVDSYLSLVLWVCGVCGVEGDIIYGLSFILRIGLRRVRLGMD